MSFLDILKKKKEVEQQQQTSQQDTSPVEEKTPTTTNSSQQGNSPHHLNNRTDSQQYFEDNPSHSYNNNNNNNNNDDYEHEVYAIHNTDHLTILRRSDSTFFDVPLAGFSRLPKFPQSSSFSSNHNNNYNNTTNNNNNNNNNKVCDPFAWEAKEVLRKNFLGRPVHLTELKIPQSMSNNNFYENNNNNNNNKNQQTQAATNNNNNNRKFSMYHITRSDGESVVSCLAKRGLAECRTNFLTYSLSGKYNTSIFTQEQLEQIEAKLKQSQDEAKKSKIGLWSFSDSSNEGRGLDTVVQTVPFPPRDDLFRIESLVSTLVGRWVKVSIEKCTSCHLHDAVIVNSLQEIRIKIAGLIAPENSSMFREGRLRISRRLLHRTVELKLAAYDRSCACFIVAFKDERPERLVRDGLALIDRRTIQFARDPDALLAESSHAIRHGAGVYANHSVSQQVLEGVDYSHIFSPEQHEFLAQVVGVPGEATVTVKPLTYFLRKSNSQNSNNNNVNTMMASSSFSRMESTSSGMAMTMTMMSPSASDVTGGGGGADPSSQAVVDSFLSQIAKTHLPKTIDINLAFIHEDTIGSSFYGSSFDDGNGDSSSRRNNEADPNFYHSPKDKSDFAFWIKSDFHSFLRMETTRAAFATRQYLRHLLIGKTVVVKPVCCCPKSSFSVSPNQESSSSDSSSLVPSSNTLFVSSKELTLFGEILVLGKREKLLPSTITITNDESNTKNNNDDDADDGDEVIYGKDCSSSSLDHQKNIFFASSSSSSNTEEEFLDVATILVHQNKVPFPRLSSVSVFGSKNPLTSSSYTITSNNNNNHSASSSSSASSKDMILPCFCLPPPSHLTQFIEQVENQSIILLYRKGIVNKELQKALNSKNSKNDVSSSITTMMSHTLALYRNERRALEYFNTPVTITKPNHANEEVISNILVFPNQQQQQQLLHQNTNTNIVINNKNVHRLEIGKTYHASIEFCEDDLTSFELLLLPQQQMYSPQDDVDHKKNNNVDENSLLCVHAKLAHVELFTSAFAYYDSQMQSESEPEKNGRNNRNRSSSPHRNTSSSPSSLLVSPETLASCKQTLKLVKQRIMMNQFAQDPYICVRFHEVTESSTSTNNKKYEYSALMCIKIDDDSVKNSNKNLDPRQKLQEAQVNLFVRTDFSLNASILKLGLGFLRDTASCCLSSICTIFANDTNNNNNQNSSSTSPYFTLNTSATAPRSIAQKWALYYLEAIQNGTGVWNFLDDLQKIMNVNNNNHKSNKNDSGVTISRLRSEFESNPFKFIPKRSSSSCSSSTISNNSTIIDSLHGKLVTLNDVNSPKILTPILEVSPLLQTAMANNNNNNNNNNSKSSIPFPLLTEAVILGLSPVTKNIVIVQPNDPNLPIVHDALMYAKLNPIESFDAPFFQTAYPGKMLIVARFNPNQDGCALQNVTPQRAVLRNVYSKSITLGNGENENLSNIISHMCCVVELVDAANDGLIEIDDVSMLKEIAEIDINGFVRMYQEQHQQQQQQFTQQIAQQKSQRKKKNCDSESFIQSDDDDDDDDEESNSYNNNNNNNNIILPPPEILQELQHAYSRMCALLNTPPLVTKNFKPAFVDDDERHLFYNSVFSPRLQNQQVVIFPLYRIRTPRLSIEDVMVTRMATPTTNNNNNNNADDDDDITEQVQQMKNGRNRKNNVGNTTRGKKNSKQSISSSSPSSPDTMISQQQQEPQVEQHFRVDYDVETYVLIKPNPQIGRPTDQENSHVELETMMTVSNICVMHLGCSLDAMAMEVFPTWICKCCQKQL